MCEHDLSVGAFEDKAQLGVDFNSKISSIKIIF